MIEEDFQCWQEYKTQRWVFNKLEVAMKLGYDCGPAGVPITKDGYYIVRPIYNLYGMGIGAKKKYLSLKDDSEDMIHHKHIPPGYFWCEWFSGKHHSVDFKKQNGRWVAFNEVVGYHYNDDNLVKFERWEVIEPSFELPEWVHELNTEKYLNIESKDTNIIEIHLRSGNDHMWGLDVGSIAYPVWDGDNYEHLKNLDFIGNMHEESFKYQADGYLKDLRLGFYIDKSKQ